MKWKVFSLVCLLSLVPVVMSLAATTATKTATAVASSKNPANLHQRITFTAMVTSPFQGVITGSITFSDSGHALASVSVENGKAKFSTNKLDGGVHAITARYGGDRAFLPSTSPELDQAIREETRVELTSSQNPSQRGQAVTFTAVIKVRS